MQTYSNVYTTIDYSENFSNFSQESTEKFLNIQATVNQLAKIVIKYHSWNDDLSRRLLQWAFSILAFDSKGELDEKATKIAQIQITALKKILVEPLYDQPLRKPMLDMRDDSESNTLGSFEWEQDILKDYIQLLTSANQAILSPYDRLPIQTKPHDFAIAILDWMDKLPMSLREEFSDSSLCLNFPIHSISEYKQNDEETKCRLATYINLAQNAIINRKMRIFIEGLDEYYSSSINQLRASVKEMHQKLEESKKREMEYERTRKEEIDHLKSIQISSVNSLNQRINKTDEKLDKTQQELEQEKIENMKQYQEICQLRQKCAHLNSQVQALANSNSSNSLCTIS